MLTFIYILIILTLIGILLLAIPKCLYRKCQVDFRILGVWIAMFAFGTLAAMFILYGILEILRWIF